MFSTPNTVVDKGYYYISYNDRSIKDYGCDTTALVASVGREVMEKYFPGYAEMDVPEFITLGVFEGSNFFILNGNHVKELSALETLDECIEYILANRDKINKLSQDIDLYLKVVKGR